MINYIGHYLVSNFHHSNSNFMISQEQIQFIESQKTAQFYEYFTYTKTKKNYTKISIMLAIILHIIIFLIKIPETTHYISQETNKNITILKKITPKFTKPQYIEPTTTKFRTLPIPDPTPDEPEPIREKKIIEPKDSIIADSTGSDLFVSYQTPSNYQDIPVRIQEKGELPVLIHKAEAEYPEEARRARIEGVVILEAVINKDGTVGEVEIIKSAHKSLDEASIKAVKQYKFIPGKINGKPVRCFFTVSITFTLH